MILYCRLQLRVIAIIDDYNHYFIEPLQFTPIAVDVLKLRRVGSLGEEDIVTMATTDDTTKQKSKECSIIIII